MTAGDVALAANEVIGQGAVVQSVRQNDVRPNEPGEQPGYEVTVDGVIPLFAGSSGFGQSTVTLQIPQAVIDLGAEGGVHWPVHGSQPVEFRAMCEGAACTIDYGTDQYLYWRGE